MKINEESKLTHKTGNTKNININNSINESKLYESLSIIGKTKKLCKYEATMRKEYHANIGVSFFVNFVSG